MTNVSTIETSSLTSRSLLERVNMQLLHIDSSITGEASVTRKLSAVIVQHLVKQHPDINVVRRDLVAEPLAYFAVGKEISSVPLHQQLVSEFLASQVVVIGAPMYNFCIPAQLKAWLDYLAVAGVTYKYTAQGSVGLAGCRRILLASSRGGIYTAGSPSAGYEHQESYLQSYFRFLGVTEITAIRAEGVRMGPDIAEKAIAGALLQINMV